MWDPHIEDEDFPEDVIVCSSIEDAEGYDIAVLVTAHKSCVDIDWQGLLTRMRTQYCMMEDVYLDLDNLSKMGWMVHAVGKPTNH